MSLLSHLLSATPLERIGWALLHSLWQFALLAAVVAGALEALRRRSANVRYLVGCAGLAAMLAAGVSTFCLTPVNLSPSAEFSSQDPPVTTSAAPSALPVTEAPLPGNHAEMPLANDRRGNPSEAQTDLPQQNPTLAAESEVPAFRSLLRRAGDAIAPRLPSITALWICGVTLLSLRNLIGWIGVQRLRRNGTTPVGQELADYVRVLVTRMKISRPVRIVQSALVQVPAVVGWLAPMILLPASVLTDLSPAQLQAILAHELAHVRRHDYLVNLLQTIAETLLFYHPAVWWLSRRIRIEREHCCDDVAVRVCGSNMGLGEALTLLEASRLSMQAVMAASGTHAGGTLHRVRRLLNPKAESVGFSRVTAAVVVLSLLIGIAVTAGWGRLATASPDRDTAVADSREGNPTESQAVEATPSPSTAATTDAATTDALIAALKDPDVNVRKNAAETLGRQKDPRAIRPLIEAFGDTRFKSFLDALKALGNFKGEQVDRILIEALKHQDGRARAIAARLLDERGWKPANREQAIRRLLAQEKWDEAVAAGPTARMVAGRWDTAEGPFELGIPIVIHLERIQRQKPGISARPWIEFRQIEGKVQGALDVRFVSWPTATWRLTLDVLNRNGSILKHVETTYANSGVIMKYPSLDREILRFDLGDAKALTDAATFRLCMRQERAWQEQDVRLDTDLPVRLTGVAEATPDVLRLNTIRFKGNDRLSATLAGQLVSGPKGDWHVAVALLDATGKVLTEDEKAIENSGVVLGIGKIQPINVSFSFGPAEKMIAQAKRFRVTLIDGPSPPAPKSEHAGKSAARHIEGRVTDTSGKPIAGAIVEWGFIRDRPEVWQRTTTDAEGRYHLEPRQYGVDYRLGVSAAGMAPQWNVFYTSWQYTKAHTSDADAIPPPVADFRLEPGHRITGVVVDEQGNPIVGAEISPQTAVSGHDSSFSMSSPSMPLPGKKIVVTTDADGRFTLDGLPAEKVQLHVTSTHRHVNDGNYDVDHRHRIVMRHSGRAGTVRIRVVDSQSRGPVPEYQVMLRHEPKPHRVSSPDGRFTLKYNFTEGTKYEVHVYARDYAPAQVDVSASPLGGNDETTVELSPGRPFLGQLLDAQSGKPLAGVPLMSALVDYRDSHYMDWPDFDSYVDGRHWYTQVQRAVSDEQGRFAFSEGGNAKGTVFALIPGHERLVLRPKDRPAVQNGRYATIKVDREATIAGVLQKTGKPLANVSMSIGRLEPRTDPEEWFERVATDAQGRYRFGGLGPGTYRIFYWTSPSRSVSVSHGVDTLVVDRGEQVTLEPADVRVLEWLSDDGTKKPKPPIALVQKNVIAKPPTPSANEDAFVLDRDIPLELSGSAAGKPNIFRPDTIRFQEKDKQLQAVVSGGVASWPQGRWRIEVVLLDSAGRVVAKHEQDVVNSGNMLDDAQIGPLARRFEFGPAEKVVPLAKRFRVAILDQEPPKVYPAKAEPPGTTSEPKQPRNQSLRGRVLDHNGKPVQNVRIERDPGDRDPIRTDKNGRFLIPDGKKYGRLTFTAPPVDGVTLAAPKQGWDDELTIRLPQPATLKIIVDIPGAIQDNELRTSWADGRGRRSEPAGREIQFYLHRFWLLPNEKDGLQHARNYVQQYTVSNPGEIVLTNMLPGFYDFSREETFVLDKEERTFFCDRQDINLAPGETKTVRLVRKRGQRVGGQLRGLPEGVAGAFIRVRPIAASGDPRKRDEWALPTFDALTCARDGQFLTSLLEPGQYKITAGAYRPDPNAKLLNLANRPPDLLGVAEVTVQDDAATDPTKPRPNVTIEMKAPDQRPAGVEPKRSEKP
jgi:beta-lactamase regulating signal transducer with metallopeptidase domain/protocatechuate 3,4-dioxygenase beta subunit